MLSHFNGMTRCFLIGSVVAMAIIWMAVSSRAISTSGHTFVDQVDDMDQTDKQRKRTGYILVTLFFIGPFVVMLAAQRLFEINLPWWAMGLLVICLAPLWVEIMKRYEPRPQERALWQNTSMRDVVGNLLLYFAGFGLILAAQGVERTNPGLATVYAVIGLALLVIWTFVRIWNNRSATK